MSELENVFIRGSKIRCVQCAAVDDDGWAGRLEAATGLNEIVHSRYIILPDMLKNAPMFKKQQVAKMVRSGRVCPDAASCSNMLPIFQGRGGGGGRGGGRGGAGRGGRVRPAAPLHSTINC